MPNHVDNDFLVTGDEKEVARFIEFARDGDCLLSANKFIPYPERFTEMDKEARLFQFPSEDYVKDNKKRKALEDEYREKWGTLSDGYNSGGYEWCIKNWGTKWGFYGITETDRNHGLWGLNFNTAWSPAIPVFEKMAEMFPMLDFDVEYFESGYGYCGHWVAKHGVVTLHESGDYSGDRGG